MPGRSREEGQSAELTELLLAWRKGDAEAEEQLMEQVYPHLRQIAARELSRHRQTPSLQVTDLVHETYVKLARPGSGLAWENRAHFFNFAATAMRRVLVDLARRRLAQKRNRGEEAITVRIGTDHGTGLSHPDILDLEAALLELGEIDDLAVRVVEARYLAGLTVDETQQALDVGRATVVRKWRFARSWLRDRLDPRDA